MSTLRIISTRSFSRRVVTSAASLHVSSNLPINRVSSPGWRRMCVIVGGLSWAMIAQGAFAGGINLGQLINSLHGGSTNVHAQPLVNSAKGQYDKYEANAQCDSIRTWLTSAPLPYGGNGSHSTQSDPAVATLIQDARFKPVFGKTYDQMDTATLNQYTSTILPHCFSVTGPLASLSPDLKGAAIRAMTSFRYGNNVRLLGQGRAASGGLAEMVSEAEGLKGDEAGYARLMNIEASAQPLLPQAPKAERDDFIQRIAVVEQRVAVPVESAETVQGIENARGYPGMVTLAKLYRAHSRPGLSSTLTAARQTDVAKIGVALNQLGTAQGSIERQSVDALGTGIAGLQQGRIWSADFKQRYTGMEFVPSVQETYQYFLAQRARALDNSRGEIDAQIRHARSNDEIAQIKARYLMDSDASLPGGVAIATAMTNQQEELRKRNALGDAYEPSGSGAAPRQVAVADAMPRASAKSQERASRSGGEPSASEMYDAIDRRAQGIAQNISEQNARCQKADRSSITSADAVVCLSSAFMGSRAVRGNEPIKIDSFQKVGCALASGKPGYVCDYVIQMSGGPVDAMRGMFTTVGNIGGGMSEARFLNAGSYWIMQVDEKDQ